ncbi:MAG: hypothetical protein GY847_28535 [Proteobacteria bacterium]|nr:hypothetical protein [Pseudomonadota bacterium]
MRGQGASLESSDGLLCVTGTTDASSDSEAEAAVMAEMARTEDRVLISAEDQARCENVPHPVVNSDRPEPEPKLG